MKFPWSKKEPTPPKGVETRTDDEMFEAIGARIAYDLQFGQIDPARSKERFVLTYLCGACDKVHELTGSATQVQNALTAFTLWGYPMFSASNAAFDELVEMDGIDLLSDGGLETAANTYREFLDRTRS